MAFMCLVESFILLNLPRVTKFIFILLLLILLEDQRQLETKIKKRKL